LSNPHFIAIVGASDELNRIEGLPIKFLGWTEYPGKIFPVNPKHWEIAGLPYFLSLLSFIVPFPSSAAR
jgi:acyl-CoA synthetase (NDP forming)